MPAEFGIAPRVSDRRNAGSQPTLDLYPFTIIRGKSHPAALHCTGENVFASYRHPWHGPCYPLNSQGELLGVMRRAYHSLSRTNSMSIFMLRRLSNTLKFGGTLAAVALCGLAPSASADDMIQTGDGILTVSAAMPEEVSVGETFSYDVTVQNASDNVIVHDLKLKQRKADGLTVESVSSGDGEDSGQEMMISTLKPGDSKTLTVKATADAEGQLRSCLEIASYTQAICLTSQVVKPQLELTKVAPKTANRCNVIELEYTLKNGGSGDVGAVKVTDSLGEGLATIDGESELTFDIDALPAGETRKFVARVYAEKAGEFSSRASAKATDSDLKSRSKETTTKVISADLAASLDGPGRLYGDELAKFTAKVTNTGNVPAEDVRVRVMYPSAANLADIGDARMTNQGPQNNQSGGQNPTMAVENAGEGQSEAEDSSMDMAEEVVMIDRLDAGQTAVFEYAVRPGDLSKLPSKIVATYVCTVDAAEGQAKATARAQAAAMQTVSIVRLPALQLIVLDDEDPVIKGDQVVYSIRVWNEGDAADNNVQLTAELPEGLEFVSAEGPTDNSKDGSTVTFQPIDTLEPGDRVDYKVTAKSVGDKAIRFPVKLTSEKLPSEVTAEEPTRLFER